MANRIKSAGNADTSHTSHTPYTTTTMSAPLRTRKPNYNLLHAQPLPLTVVPLPPLIPHNPLSLLHILYAYLFSRAPAHPQPLYRGAFDSATSSVHVTDPASIQAFWNHGFFGKGSLSRSEPTWLSRRRRALGILGKDEALTAEEITERRRRERRDFKAERARAEKERIQRQLAEEGKLLDPAAAAAVTEEDRKSDSGSVRSVHFAPAADVKPSLAHAFDQPTPVPAVVVVADVRDLEHLQLTLEEAFFLAYGLGVLQITDPEDGGNTLDVHQLLDLARRHSYFPPLEPGAALEPDDPFLLNYVVYHHFRSLGWVVKPGIKFGVDYRTSPPLPLSFSLSHHSRILVSSRIMHPVLLVPGSNMAAQCCTTEAPYSHTPSSPY